MYDVKSERDAVRYGILDKMQALENDLNKIDGIVMWSSISVITVSSVR